MSFARNFPMGKENRFNIQFRVEFQNVFNRLFLSAPQHACCGALLAPSMQRAG
jgi:hypothetical protein